MTTRANEPIHPSQHCTSDGSVCQPCDGLTIREHFAGLAMQGILAAPRACATTSSGIAKDAIAVADALLTELAKPAMRPHRHTAECDADCTITEERV